MCYLGFSSLCLGALFVKCKKESQDWNSVPCCNTLALFPYYILLPLEDGRGVFLSERKKNQYMKTLSQRKWRHRKRWKDTDKEAGRCQKNKARISLEVQWLRIHLPKQGMQVRFLMGTLRSHMPQDLSSKLQLLSPHAINKDPACHSEDLTQPNK